ncbi:hypothetical protein ACQ4PT_027525 [Festuca glaucescens]
MATAAQKTSSTHRTAVFRGAHKLDILGYTTRRRLGGADNTVRSRSFDAGGFLWTLVCRFRQKLLKGVTLASISLELSRNETDEAVVATASIQIDDPSGTGRWPAAEWHGEEPNVFPARSSTAVAWELAVPDAFHEHEERYVDEDADCLTVHCTVDVHREESVEGPTSRSCLVSTPPPPSLGKDIHRLREKMHRCHHLEASCVEYMVSNPDVYDAVEASEEYKELDKTCPSYINEITRKVAKRAVARNRSLSSSSSFGDSNNRETMSTSRYNPSAVMIGTHEFRIESLSALRKTHNVLGQYVETKFQVGGREWMMMVYPSGERDEYKEYIGLFLSPLIHDDTNLKASVTVNFIDPSGKPSYLSKFTHIYGRKCDKYGWPGIITVAYAN